jgi:hypothetical protein
VAQEVYKDRFRTHSWSWVEITHLCHLLHNLLIRFVFSRYIRRMAPLLFLSRDPSSSLQRAACRAAAGASRRKIVEDVTNSPFAALFLAHKLGDEEPVVQPTRAEVRA